MHREIIDAAHNPQSSINYYRSNYFEEKKVDYSMPEANTTNRAYSTPPISYDYAAILIGQTGSGKSTFINTLVNYMMGGMPGDLVIAIKSEHYPIVDPRFQDNKGNISNSSRGSSQTVHAHYYLLSSPHFQSKTFLFIDTPGLASTHGLEDDEKCISTILEAASGLTKLNAIIYVQNGRESRLITSVEHSINILKKAIPEVFENNIILVYSNCTLRTTFNTNWLKLDVKLEVMMDNEYFQISNEEYQDYEILKKMNKRWTKSCEKIEEILAKIISMVSEDTSVYKEVYQANNSMKIEIFSMKLILKETEIQKQLLKTEVDRIENIRKNIIANKDYVSTGHSFITKMVPTTYHNTICFTCTKLCHRMCRLEYTTVRGHTIFQGCHCMSGNYCNICKCSHHSHFHDKSEPVREMISVTSIIDSKKIKFDQATKNKNDHDKKIKQITFVIEKINKETEVKVKVIGENIKKLKQLTPKFEFSTYVTKREEIQRSQIERKADMDAIKDFEIDQIVYRKIMKFITSFS